VRFSASSLLHFLRFKHSSEFSSLLLVNICLSILVILSRIAFIQYVSDLHKYRIAM
jgi:hypothetical protein